MFTVLKQTTTEHSAGRYTVTTEKTDEVLTDRFKFQKTKAAGEALKYK